MSEVVIDYDMLNKKRDEFNRSKLPQKYGVKFDDLIDVVNPSAGNRLDSALGLFNNEIGIAHLRNIYDRFFGPVFPGYETSFERRKFVTRLNEDVPVNLQNFQTLPHQIQAVAKKCLTNNLNVKLVNRHKNSAKSATKVKINNYICKIYMRTVSLYRGRKPCIHLEIARRSLRECDFIIVHGTTESFGDRTYIIPAEDLLNAKPQNDLGFIIPIQRLSNRGRRTLVDWNKYLFNFTLLR